MNLVEQKKFGELGSRLEVRPQGDYQNSDIWVESMLNIKNP